MLASFVKSLRQSKIVGDVVRRSYSSKDPTFETLAVSVPKKHVFHVELNRPMKANTFTNEMWLEFEKCFNALSDMPECRVIVLSARGKHFTGGIDLYSMMEMHNSTEGLTDAARKASILYKHIKQYQDSMTSLERCSAPVLSAIHGACVGAGVDLVTAGDIRYCSADAWFQVKEVDVGLAADVGTLQRLPKVIGNTSTARELCYTGRKFDAREALELGLVTKILPDRESAISHALEVASQIALKSPVAVKTTKRSLVYSQSRTTDKGLKHIRLINSINLQSEDLINSATAQATKSPTPEFDNY